MRMSLNNQEKILQKAAQILEERAANYGSFLESPDATKKMFQCKLATAKQELFAVGFLDNRHRLISCDIMFYGTINSASVYPREVVRAALDHNAAAVVFAHNHPSGIAEPSRADIEITRKLKDSLALIDVRVLDHLIVTPGYCVSLAERGEI